MSEIKIKQSIQNLEKALTRLQEALAEPETNPLAIDGTIQRFEFAIEVYWKTLKRLLEQEGIEAKTPKEALKKAYGIGWLQDENAWLQMLKDRNEASHVYDQQKAKEIYQHIRAYYPVLSKTFQMLVDRFG